MEKQLNLFSNHFKLSFKNQIVYLYSIDFGPNLRGDDFKVREEQNKAIKNIDAALTQRLGSYLYARNNIFTLTPESQQYKSQCIRGEFELLAESKGLVHTLKFRMMPPIDMGVFGEQRQEYKILLDFLLAIVKKGLRRRKFNQIGKLPKLFLKDEKREVKGQEVLEAWPGYEINTKRYSDGIYVNIDTCTKFINRSSILQDLDYYTKDLKWSKNKVIEFFQREEEGKGKTVMTINNYRIYQIDCIVFDQTPKTVVIDREVNGKEVKMDLVTYYKQKYQLDIPDNQPMLQVNQRRGTIFLPCSICHEASISEEILNDFKSMKGIQEAKISTPSDRYRRIQQVFKYLKNNEEFKEWGLEVSDQFQKVKAKVLPPPQVLAGQNQVDFKQYASGKVKHCEPLHLQKNKWIIAYPSSIFNDVDYFYQSMVNVSGRLGIKVEDPQWAEVQFKKQQNLTCEMIMSEIMKFNPKQAIIVMVIMPTTSKIKSEIKRQLNAIGVPSQFIIPKNQYDRKRQGEFKTNGIISIFAQMAAKIRRDPYHLNLDLGASRMIVGFDYALCKGEFVLAFTASYNRYLTKHYSTIIKQGKHADVLDQAREDNRNKKDVQDEIITVERTEIICNQMKIALQVYQEENKGNLPDEIFFYRDGVGGPTLEEKLLSIEIQEVIAYLHSYQAGYKPKILYCLIDKRVSHRLFLPQGSEFENPGPGVCLDKGLVHNQGQNTFDFFMIPQHATVATALPVHYKVVANSTGHSNDFIQKFTYHLCYAYVNFGGSIKVPATAMYAGKLANFAVEHRLTPHNNLSKNLHFL